MSLAIYHSHCILQSDLLCASLLSTWRWCPAVLALQDDASRLYMAVLQHVDQISSEARRVVTTTRLKTGARGVR
jgi:hypothetical protein